MIVHILCMYKYKHPWTWDEGLPYVQHNYNKSLRNSIGNNPFQVGMGFQPLYAHVQFDVDKVSRFIERIQHIW